MNEFNNIILNIVQLFQISISLQPDKSDLIYTLQSLVIHLARQTVIPQNYSRLAVCE